MAAIFNVIVGIIGIARVKNKKKEKKKSFNQKQIQPKTVIQIRSYKFMTMTL